MQTYHSVMSSTDSGDFRLYFSLPTTSSMRKRIIRTSDTNESPYLRKFHVYTNIRIQKLRQIQIIIVIITSNKH